MELEYNPVLGLNLEEAKKVAKNLNIFFIMENVLYYVENKIYFKKMNDQAKKDYLYNIAINVQEYIEPDNRKLTTEAIRDILLEVENF